MRRCLVALLVLLTLQSQAYVGSVSAASGRTGLAAVEASETPYGNPAALAFLNGYYFTAGFGASQQTQRGATQDLSISLTENMKETVVPTALSFVQQTSRPEGMANDVLGRSFKLSFANFLRPGLSLGFGINHQNDRMDEETYDQTNLQIGFLWAPNRELGAAVAFENVVPPSLNTPEGLRLQQKSALGFSYNYKKFVRFKGDVITTANNSFEKPILGAGMESYMNRWMILRWGLQRDNLQDANLYTAGLGFIGPKFGLHYAYQNSPQNESLTRHSVDLAVPIW